MYVTTEGKVVPCCVVAIPETWCMGDITRGTIKDIWNNDRYRELRKKIYQNKLPETCLGCYDNSSEIQSTNSKRFHIIWNKFFGMKV